MPDFSLEIEMPLPVAGIDEVGRGSWAGPVLACACIINPLNFSDELASKLDDSKKLTAKRRQDLYEPLLQSSIIGIGQASVEEIDKYNILQATFMAMRRALADLPQIANSALVDGNKDPTLGIATKTIIKGDNKSFSIAAASVIAKVTRDKIMQDLSIEFPHYAWDRNAGYGTKAHIDGLAKFGITTHHRKSFAPIDRLLK